jgi:protein O-GlcNAc transferase
MSQAARRKPSPVGAEELARTIFQPANRDRTDDMLAAISALRGVPASAPALITLAQWASTKRAFAVAADLFEQAVQVAPNNAEAHAMLGAALYQSGRTQEALSAMRRAAAMAPNSLNVRGNLGALLFKSGQTEEAIEHLTFAVIGAPDDINARLNLAEAVLAQKRYEDAFVMAQSALDSPEFRERAFLVIAAIYRANCDLERLIYYLRQAVDATETTGSVTPYLFNLQASDAYSDTQVFEEHVRLGARFDHTAAKTKWHANLADPERRLRIGFVSGDFYNHPVAIFITPLLRYLDRARFEVFAFPNNLKHDQISDEMRALCDHWIPICGAADSEAAAQIEAAQIDVLIDLSGHTADNRLPVFGMKPAPVQATYLGYPGTTGMTTMDYRITCEAIDPAGTAESFYTEKLVRLPGLFAPFRPTGDMAINGLPCLSGAPFTFACLNQTWRVNPSVVRAWAQILHQTPQSRLLLGNVDTPMIAQRLIKMFGDENIAPERLVLVERQRQHAAYLGLHHHIDLGLDTFPYNGGTTTTFSLWMGVPVVTLQGVRAAMRSGGGVLGEAGLTSFVTQTPEDYVRCAADWAQRPHALQQLRQALRVRVKICDLDEQIQQASEFGDALRAMWREWCAQK